MIKNIQVFLPKKINTLNHFHSQSNTSSKKINFITSETSLSLQNYKMIQSKNMSIFNKIIDLDQNQKFLIHKISRNKISPIKHQSLTLINNCYNFDYYYCYYFY